MAAGGGVWLDAVRRLRAIAQNGLTYADNPFDRERYTEVRQVAARLASLESGDVETLAGSFAEDSGYATPKIDVRAAAFIGGQVLLVRNADDGLWSLPGGWAEVAERPRTAAEKELFEETGYRGRVLNLVGVFDCDIREGSRWPAHIWQLVFLCEVEAAASGKAQADEVFEVGLFRADGLPALSRRSTEAQLAASFALARDGNRPCAID